MSRIRVIASLVLLVSILHASAAAQLRSPLNAPADPFTISPGSTFAASGGSRGARPNASELVGKIAAVTSDISEAEALIEQNQINGRDVPLGHLTKWALTGSLHSLDPHSNFFDPAEWKDLMDEERSGYTGIGASIANFATAGVTDTYLLCTFPGSPAARSEVRFGDRVVAINGEKMTGMPSDFVRDKIRGASGTTLRLTLERAATNRVETIEIRRGRVPQPSIPDAYILKAGVGYIDLTGGFNYTTYAEFDAAMQELKRSGMHSLVLDLRGNGGGIVDQAVKVTESFLPAGTLILTQRGRTAADNREWTSANLNAETMPLVVLVDQHTASASEIVAGAFQDNDRALIVGQKTFGKGLVQSVIALPEKAGLTLTAARYLTPSGRSIQRDYSKIDLYDYYNHKEVAAGIDKPYFEARTVTNRPVFGGDGIQPDEAVKSNQISDLRSRLLDPIFFFAREVVNSRVAGLENYRNAGASSGRRVTQSDFPVSDSLMAAFTDFALATPTGWLSARDLENEAAFIKLRLRYDIIMAAFGTASANQLVIDTDPQVARAVEILPRAAQLSRSAAKARHQPVR